MNEDIAKQICDVWCNGSSISCKKGMKCEAFLLAMEVAERKDEQIKDKIEQFFSEHDDWDYQVNYIDNYTDMDRLKIELINFIGL